VPRYFFVVREPDDERHDDTNGTIFADDTGALAYAEQVMRELKDAGGYDDPGWVIVVEDAAGRTLAALPFAEAERSSEGPLNLGRGRVYQ